jgi:hypothetical protein
MEKNDNNWKKPWNEMSAEDYKYAKTQSSEKWLKSTPESLAAEMSEIKDKITLLEDEYSLKSKELNELMKNSESKTVTFLKKGKRFTARLVEGTRTVVNEESLKKLIPASIWETILVSKVDQVKLSRAITSGEINAEVVSEAVAIVPSSPYWRFTDKKDKGDASS